MLPGDDTDSMAGIPIRCFTCGSVLADKWHKYQADLLKYNEQAQKTSDTPPVGEKPFRIVKATESMAQTQTPEARALDDAGLHRYCCRRMFLSAVDLLPLIV